MLPIALLWRYQFFCKRNPVISVCCPWVMKEKMKADSIAVALLLQVIGLSIICTSCRRWHTMKYHSVHAFYVLVRVSYCILVWIMLFLLPCVFRNVLLWPSFQREMSVVSLKYLRGNNCRLSLTWLTKPASLITHLARLLWQLHLTFTLSLYCSYDWLTTFSYFSYYSRLLGQQIHQQDMHGELSQQSE